jgi:phage gpG-like protein
MITTYLSGDAELVRKFEAMPDRLRDELTQGIGKAALKLQREVVQNKLSGQVLNVQTGTLRRSIDQVVTISGNSVVGIVLTNVNYARIHEYGFSGTVSVRESLRLIKKAFGKSITPKTVTVKAHSRKVNLPERSFLRSALRDLSGSGVIQGEIDAAVARALT